MPRSRRHTRPKRDDAPLVRPPAPPPAIDPLPLSQRIRLLHEQAEDPNVERMPPPDELWGVLTYCERHAAALRRYPKIAGEVALLCVQLWEYVGHQRDLGEGRAAQRALDAGVTLEKAAGPLRVSGPSGALKKIRRFRAVELSLRPEIGPVRRTHEAVSRVEGELAAAERARRRKRVSAENQGPQWHIHAKSLLEAQDGLPRDDAGIIAFWLEQMEYDLDQESSAGILSHDVQSLVRVVDATVRHGEGGSPEGRASEVIDEIKQLMQEDESS